MFKVLILFFFIFLQTGCSINKKERTVKRNKEILAEYKRSKRLSIKSKPASVNKKIKEYTPQDRYYYDNHWGISIYDGKDTEYHKFPSATKKMRFGANGECLVGKEIEVKFGVFYKDIICPTFKKKLLCTDNYLDPDEDYVFCKKTWKYQGITYHLSVKLNKYFHRDYWRKKSRKFELEHKGTY